ncbi:hypothetical protein PC129_g8493 [Phytophthora cactorum]|uniref:Uncharacterized protein n=1 Tax=Phytophthora cactorum TaxID=29920 RepID=A0A8T1CJ96_9STRA|nr:hypothetical protein Pcac1_g4783 [Phytophthora cactorum]KAG2908696.1 hypothetical protein PC114_g10340 [Phytophthora cactorum]KAG2922737.1 hypothetical protein PC115_g9159 [Phytophthora cactorum]KAG2945281.1 hypothetical protein PC117_g8586 [Phytophthora cactorum]KAG3024982.1 hypothetical protein PC120_g6763 [Phytophthora cactorum]
MDKIHDHYLRKTLLGQPLLRQSLTQCSPKDVKWKFTHARLSETVRGLTVRVQQSSGREGSSNALRSRECFASKMSRILMSISADDIAALGAVS